MPGVCDAQLPRVEVDTVRWNQWKTAVSRAAETRPGLETMIVSAFISAMHHPCCKCSCYTYSRYRPIMPKISPIILNFYDSSPLFLNLALLKLRTAIGST